MKAIPISISSVIKIKHNKYDNNVNNTANGDDNDNDDDAEW